MKTIPALLMAFSTLLAGPAASQVPPSGANERTGDIASRPNILVILADDMGYGDTGFNGCKDIPTPAIDSIARNGVRFSAGYVTAPQCAPSRAGLLSGRYQNEFGCEVNDDLDKHGIPVGLRLFGDYLHPAGYRTGLVGKWHLGETPECHPNKRGFDDFFGFVTGGHIYDCDQLLATPPPERRVYYKLLERNGVPEKTTGYLTTVLGRECADFIHRQKDQPWFLYAAFNAPHTPLQATPELLDRVKHISDKQRRTYAAMVVGLEDAVGKILAQLKADGLEESTLVVFLSDNGGPTDKSSASNAPLRGVKGDTLEGGIRVPFAIQWKGVIPAGQTIDSPVSSLDLLPTAMAAAGEKIPKDAAFAGMNLLPLLTGKAKAEPRTLTWRFPMRSLWAVRQGDFKLVKEWPRGQSKESPGQKQPEAKNKIGLYQLNADLAESNDLSASQPEKRKKLQSAYDAWTASLPAQHTEGKASKEE
jgi:arylsulfatase A-like enzyme